jgi:hypothetical protein
MDLFEHCDDAMLPGDAVLLVYPPDWSDRAAHGRVTRRWRASVDTLVVLWEAAPPSLREAVVPREELRHEGRCPETFGPGERVRVEGPETALARGTTGRVVAINAEGWVAVAPDGTVDTLGHVRRADLRHL